jgi:chromosome partitioning protein
VKLVAHLGKPLIFVMNAAPPRARITSEAIALVSQHGPLAPAIIHQRVDFASSMIDGRTVMELPGTSRSAREIAQLWTYLERQPQYPGMPMVPGFAAPPPPLSAFGATGA